MNIEKVKWDSDFFGYNVSKLEITDENILPLDIVINNDYKLLYIFSKTALPDSFLNKINAYIVDEKVIFSKKKNDVLVSKDFSCIRDLGFTTNDIYNLAFESGEYSRYNIDKNFVRDEFKKLYTCWIENSIKKIIADKSVGYYVDDKLTGIITFKAKDNKLDIGLIAVDKKYRGKKIGSSLLDFAMYYTQQNNYSQITVATQGKNFSAVNFYIRNGYTLTDKTYVYHLWK